MSAADFYDQLNDRLASDAWCDRESTEDECDLAIALGAAEEEELATASDVAVAIEQEQILEASRSVKAGTNMLFAALRQNGVL